MGNSCHDPFVTAFNLARWTKMNKYEDDFICVFGRNQFACAETEYARCMRSFPTSFHGSLILADAHLAFKLILDKVRNNKNLPWYCNQLCTLHQHSPNTSLQSSGRLKYESNVSPWMLWDVFPVKVKLYWTYFLEDSSPHKKAQDKAKTFSIKQDDHWCQTKWDAKPNNRPYLIIAQLSSSLGIKRNRGWQPRYE